MVLSVYASSDRDLNNFLMPVGEVLAVLLSINVDESSLPSVTEGVDASQSILSWSQVAVLLDKARFVFNFTCAINRSFDFVFHFNATRHLETHVSAGYDGQNDTVQDEFHYLLIINSEPKFIK